MEQELIKRGIYAIIIFFVIGILITFTITKIIYIPEQKIEKQK